MKPRIKPRPKTGDADSYDVWLGQRHHRIIISGLMQAVTRKHPLELLAEEVRRLTAPSH